MGTLPESLVGIHNHTHKRDCMLRASGPLLPRGMLVSCIRLLRLQTSPSMTARYVGIICATRDLRTSRSLGVHGLNPEAVHHPMRKAGVPTDRSSTAAAWVGRCSSHKREHVMGKGAIDLLVGLALRKAVTSGTPHRRDRAVPRGLRPCRRGPSSKPCHTLSDKRVVGCCVEHCIVYFSAQAVGQPGGGMEAGARSWMDEDVSGAGGSLGGRDV